MLFYHINITRVYWRCVTNDQYTAETCDNDLITLDELQKRLEPLTRELAAVDSELAALAAPPPDSLQALEAHRRCALEGLLSLETVKNSDMRRLIDHILISRDGNVRVILRKFDGMPET